jgi:hypothetical protein
MIILNYRALILIESKDFSRYKKNTCKFSLFCSHLYLAQPWRWRRFVPPKCWLTFNGLYGVICQKIVLCIPTTVRTSKHTVNYFSRYSIKKCSSYLHIWSGHPTFILRRHLKSSMRLHYCSYKVGKSVFRIISYLT